MDIQAEISDLFEDNGRFGKQRPVPNTLISEYSGKVPDFLLEVWKTHGLGDWGQGLYNLCSPNDFSGLLAQIFHADDNLSHQDCHVFGYSAFGRNLSVWSERYGVVNIDLLNARVSCQALTNPTRKIDANIAMSTALSMYADALKAMNVFDDDGKPLFARAVKKLGNLDVGQAFGFFPALAMGGAPRLENLRIVPALEHFIFLAQLQPFKLVDYLASPPQIVREIG